jgi:hypothetical protein
VILRPEKIGEPVPSHRKRPAEHVFRGDGGFVI